MYSRKDEYGSQAPRGIISFEVIYMILNGEHHL